MRRGARAAVAFVLAAIVCILCLAPPASAAAPACTKAAARNAVVDTGFTRKVKARLGSSTLRPGETVLGLFRIATPICADVTGDGAREMIVALRCCTVSSPSPWAIFKASASGRWALRYARIRTVTTSLRVNGDGDVEEKMPDYGPNDPNCCPSRHKYIRAHWNGTHFQTLRGRG